MMYRDSHIYYERSKKQPLITPWPVHCPAAEAAAWVIIKVDKYDPVISFPTNPSGIDRYVLPSSHGMILDNYVWVEGK